MKTVCYRLITNTIPERIMDSRFSVFAVSNMGRMAKLTIFDGHLEPYYGLTSKLPWPQVGYVVLGPSSE